MFFEFMKKKTSFLPHFQPLSPSGLSPEGKEKRKRVFQNNLSSQRLHTKNQPHYLIKK
jgi:hypothetical protein